MRLKLLRGNVPNIFSYHTLAESQGSDEVGLLKKDNHDKIKDSKDYLNKIETPHVAWSVSNALTTL